MNGLTSTVPPRWSLDESRGTIQIYEAPIDPADRDRETTDEADLAGEAIAEELTS
jgi:hypothetical protein